MNADEYPALRRASSVVKHITQRVIGPGEQYSVAALTVLSTRTERIRESFYSDFSRDDDWAFIIVVHAPTQDRVGSLKLIWCR